MAAHAIPSFDEDENGVMDEISEFEAYEAELVASGGIGQCRVCGCTDIRGCPEGCIWAEADLCSRCA